MLHGDALAVTPSGDHQHPGAGAAGFGAVVAGFLDRFVVVGRIIAGLTDPRGDRGGQNIKRHQLITTAKAHGSHAACCPPQGPQLIPIGSEVNRHTRSGADQNTVFLAGQAYPAQLVAFFEGNGDQAVGADVAKGREHGFFDVALLGQHHQVQIFREFRNGDHRGDFFVVGNRQQLNDRRASGSAGAGGNLVGAEGIDHAPIAEEQDSIAIAASQEMLYLVVVLHLRAGFAPGGAVLGLEGADGHPLDVALLRNHDRGAIVSDQVNFFQLGAVAGNGGAARRGKPSLQVAHFLFNDRQHPIAPGQDVLQIRDFGLQFLVFLLDLVRFQGRQTAQLHLQNRVRLGFREAVIAH